VIGVNPIRSGYNAVADDRVGITPGTDGLFILSLVHELMRAGKIDLDYLARHTHAPVLVNADTKSHEHGLFLRDEDVKPLVIDRTTGKLTAFDTPGMPLDGPHLGYPRGPEDLALKDDGSPARIDKALTWENPTSAHGLMHMVISNTHAGGP
jgi:anaerobic selenocysteine-containing dehydrogenase